MSRIQRTGQTSSGTVSFLQPVNPTQPVVSGATLEQIQALQASVSSLNSNITSLQSSLSTANSNIASLQSQDGSATQSTINAGFTNRLNSVEATNTSISNVNTNQQVAIGALTSQVGELNTALTGQYTLNQEQTTSLGWLSERITTLDQQVVNLGNNVSSFTGNYASLTSQVSGHATNITNLQNQYSSLNTTVGNINAATMQTDIAALQANVTTLFGNISTINNSLYNDYATKASLATLQGSLSTLTSTVSTNQTILMANDTKTTAHEGQLVVLTTAANEALTRFGLIEAANITQGDNINTNLNSITTLQGRCTDIETVNTQQAQSIATINLTLSNTNIGTIANDLSALQTLSAKYRGWASTVSVNDIGGGNSTLVPFTGTFLTSVTRTSNTNNTSVVMNWTDRGYDIVPIITVANYSGSASITDVSNSQVNDIAPVVLVSGSITRTSCRVYLEETGSMGTQTCILYCRFIPFEAV